MVEKEIENSLYTFPTFLYRDKKIIKKIVDASNKITARKLANLINQQRFYTLFKKPAPTKIKSNHYFVTLPNELFEMDLMYLNKYGVYTEEAKYVMVVIDCFSRKIFTRCMKKKTPDIIVKKFEEILKENGAYCRKIKTDLGTEFMNKTFQGYLKSKNIDHLIPTTNSLSKCAMAERAIRTLKSKMVRYVAIKELNKSSMDICKMIYEITYEYNHDVSSATGYAPVDIAPANVVSAYGHIHKYHYREPLRIYSKSLLTGSYVRIKQPRPIFDKAVLHVAWSKEIFRVKQVIHKFPHRMYAIENLDGKEIKKHFYDEELQEINLPENMPIKILQSNLDPKTMKTRFHVEMVNGAKKWIEKSELEKITADNNRNNISDVIQHMLGHKKNRK